MASSPLSALYEAIKAKDRTAFDQALAQVDDINADNGGALIAAAEAKRFDFMTDIFVKGAIPDIAEKTILGNRKKIESSMPSVSHRQKTEAEMEYDRYTKIYETFYMWNKNIERMIEARKVATLDRIADDLAAFRKSAEELLQPSHFDKTRTLAAPASKGSRP